MGGHDLLFLVVVVVVVFYETLARSDIPNQLMFC